MSKHSVVEFMKAIAYVVSLDVVGAISKSLEQFGMMAVMADEATDINAQTFFKCVCSVSFTGNSRTV